MSLDVGANRGPWRQPGAKGGITTSGRDTIFCKSIEILKIFDSSHANAKDSDKIWVPGVSCEPKGITTSGRDSLFCKSV